MLSFEHRWVRLVLEGFTPRGNLGLAPKAGEVDFAATFRLMRRKSTWVAALGLRLAVWMTTLAPIWMRGRPRLLGSLSQRDRSAVLSSMLVHRWFAVRELTLLLKMAACFALFESPAIRQRSNYDSDGPGYDDVLESGERPALRHLPILGNTPNKEIA